MNIHARNLLIAFLVAFVVSGGLAFLLVSLEAEWSGDAVDVVLAPGAFLGAITFYVLWNLSGNRRTASASPEQLRQAASFQPPAGRALIYIVRKGFVAKAAGMDVLIDDVLRAQLKAPRFTCLAVAPGSHELTAALGGGAGRQSSPQSQQLTLAEGECLGVQVSVKMGMVQGALAFETLAGEPLRNAIRGLRMVAPIEN